MRIFSHVPLMERSLMQKIFRQHPIENAVIELNNLLASNPLDEISEQDVMDIEASYGISFQPLFRPNLEEFYAVTLNYFLKDKILTHGELADLEKLKALLSLSDKSIAKIHELVGTIVYQKSFEEIVADGRITDEERRFVEKLETDLKLPQKLTEKISSQVRTGYIQNYVTQAIKDQRLSPEEEQELQQIAKSLNVNLQMDSATQQQFEKLKLYWAIENEELEELSINIKLQKAEKCYFFANNVDWHELRSYRSGTHYSGYSMNIKIVKGFYLKTGSYTPKSVSSEHLTVIDTGTLYLTNKRIIFTGYKKNSNLRLEKILNITPYSDGVEISKETGRSPVLKIKGNADVFCMILDRLIKEM